MPLHIFTPLGLGFHKHDIMLFTYRRHKQKHVMCFYLYIDPLGPVVHVPYMCTGYKMEMAKIN